MDIFDNPLFKIFLKSRELWNEYTKEELIVLYNYDLIKKKFNECSLTEFNLFLNDFFIKNILTKFIDIFELNTKIKQRIRDVGEAKIEFYSNMLIKEIEDDKNFF